MSRDFVWRDAGRTVVFGEGGVERAPELLAEQGIAEFELLSTPRALAEAPALAAAATRVHEVGAGQVPDLAADLLQGVIAISPPIGGKWRSHPEAGGVTLVALGGGRVIDTAKAIASVTEADVAAIPTTMSGAELTTIHRLPAGAEDRAGPRVRPRLVIADPEAMTSQPEPLLRASSMNALAHGADSLYTPLSNPVAEMAALRGAALIAAALDESPAQREPADLAIGSILCGYAIDSAGFSLHHVVCQTLVRLCGTPHAETNAAILPHAVTLLSSRAPEAFGPLATALGTDFNGLEPRLLDLAGNPAPLSSLASDPANLDAALEAMFTRPELSHVPGLPLTQLDLAGLVSAAW
ncbi:MAG: iron-containing alcohol dehydrogenase [Thermoleophilia bacterium]|nr:iron-containing alcohol dehydrogenase [Thermoleophilia bacterium]